MRFATKEETIQALSRDLQAATLACDESAAAFDFAWAVTDGSGPFGEGPAFLLPSGERIVDPGVGWGSFEDGSSSTIHVVLD